MGGMALVARLGSLVGPAPARSRLRTRYGGKRPGKAAGCATVKVTGVSSGNLGWTRIYTYGALRGPMPEIPLMVTGGVEPTPESIQTWLGAGVQAVGIGSQLFKGDFSNDFPALSRRIKALLEAIQ